MDIAIDKVRALIVEARRLDVKDGDNDPQSGSDAMDDRNVDTLSASDPDEASEHEFRGMIAGLNIDERADLLALLYIGRGDFAAGEWEAARALALERDAASLHLGNYLVDTPNLPDLLGEGLAAIGLGLDDESEGSAEAAAENGVEIHRLRRLDG
ncbi:DUF3775 domain-containing protein [Labrys sp. LIt4]|uniref:DUF3775 domain-containing protein n=1 Tax=Labrys sp. LIt4 TaxID=2821355 RepID=UPI001ADF1A63|nr:DUF3775 domain-containing protein [Labrys sp. LIt4]MBP0582776.1 DUF3775 domain-containing protein [Labrys sp. LIt4]